MKRENVMKCDRCGAELIIRIQDLQSGVIVNTAQEDQLAFISQHINMCRDGEPPTPQDKAFSVLSRDVE